VESFKYNYEKNQKRINDRKDEIFRIGNINKYEIPSEYLTKLDQNLLQKNKDYALQYMLPKDTDYVLNLKRIYGYYNNQIITDFNRVRDLNAQKHKNQFIKVSEKLSDIITSVSLY
jgi:hypothetical protein